MKKRLCVLLALCLTLTGCSGLPTAREMGDMALLRTLGVDASPEGVAVTGSTGPRARGVQAEGEAALTLAADRESLSAACLAMQGQSDSYVFFGYVDQLLVGEELARDGVRPVLDYFSRDSELGLGAQFWLVRGTPARDAVSAGGERGVDSTLETLRHDGEMGIAALTRTAGEVYAGLLEVGAAFAPALSATGEENAALGERGYGILKGDRLAGFLDGEEACGLELLAGGVRTDVLEVDLPNTRVSVKVNCAGTRSELVFQKNSPELLKVNCRVTAELAEYDRPLTARELELLEETLAVREQQRAEAALKQLRAWQADAAGLGAQAAMVHPVRWEKIREEWPGWFARIPVEVRVQVKLDR